MSQCVYSTCIQVTQIVVGGVYRLKEKKASLSLASEGPSVLCCCVTSVYVKLSHVKQLNRDKININYCVRFLLLLIIVNFIH